MRYAQRKLFLLALKTSDTLETSPNSNKNKNCYCISINFPAMKVIFTYYLFLLPSTSNTLQEVIRALALCCVTYCWLRASCFINCILQLSCKTFLNTGRVKVLKGSSMAGKKVDFVWSTYTVLLICSAPLPFRNQSEGGNISARQGCLHNTVRSWVRNLVDWLIDWK